MHNQGLETTRICRYLVAGRQPFPSEGGYAEGDGCKGVERRLVDGPSDVDAVGRNKDGRARRGGEEEKERGGEKKMGSQLFFRLACTVGCYSLGEKCILRPFPGLTHL